MYGLLMYAPALAVVAIGRRRLPAVEFAGDTGAALRDLT
jgi:hypothetical protein